MPSVSKLAPSQWLVTGMEDRRGVDEEEGGVCIKEILARVLTLIHFDKTLQVARPQENLLVFRRNFGEKSILLGIQPDFQPRHGKHFKNELFRKFWKCLTFQSKYF